MESHVPSQKYQTAATMIKVTGILSIIFGSIGILFGIGYSLLIAASPSYAYNEVEIVPIALIVGFLIMFWVIPHIYMIISGIYFLNKPSAAKVRGLAITSIVIGAIFNVILLAFAIINLIQAKDYENEFDVTNKAS